MHHPFFFSKIVVQGSMYPKFISFVQLPELHIFLSVYMAESHYLNQCWVSSIMSTDIHMKAFYERYLRHQSLNLAWKLLIDNKNFDKKLPATTESIALTWASILVTWVIPFLASSRAASAPASSNIRAISRDALSAISRCFLRLSTVLGSGV